AIGRIGLRKLSEWNERRRQVAARYSESLTPVAHTPPEKTWARDVYHMYVIRTKRRDALADFLRSKGISTGVHYPMPNHQQPAITTIYSHLPTLPQTEAAVKEILSLPIDGALAPYDVDYVCHSTLQF